MLTHRNGSDGGLGRLETPLVPGGRAAAVREGIASSVVNSGVYSACTASKNFFLSEIHIVMATQTCRAGLDVADYAFMLSI